LSYARLFQNRPPLVIVTNGGDDTRVYDSMTGDRLAGATVDEQKLNELFAVAGKVAAGNLKKAIETLLGPNSDVWAKAVSEATKEAINEQTDISRA